MENLIRQYCGTNHQLADVLLRHSRAVARLAVECARKHPELGADERFVYEAAMLHDIGVFLCDAPGIHCHGPAPYVMHGRLGAELLRALGMPRHARVAERHTGTGLPGYEPETIEEKLVCYADKWFSKTRPDERKTLNRTIASLAKWGGHGVGIFMKWHAMFR